VLALDPTDRLRSAYDRYALAQQHGDREEIVTARRALCLALTAAGWEAPDPVREQISRDAQILRRLREYDTIDLTDSPGGPSHDWDELVDLRVSA
jgi:hypothetical protein